MAVAFSTGTGTATPGDDFQPTAGFLFWQDGETGAKSFEIALVVDGIEEGPETIPLRLEGPLGNAELGDPGLAVLTLVDTAAVDIPVLSDLALLLLALLLAGAAVRRLGVKVGPHVEDP